MRATILAVLVTGCGFTASGQGNPNADASAIDARAIGGDGAIADGNDAAQSDAAVGALCPITYAPIPTLVTSGSRYRFVTTTAKWIDAENDCADDAGGGELATHLIVLDDAAEQTAMIGGLASGLNINDQWAGATDLQAEDMIRYVTAQASTLSLNPSMQADNKDCIRIKNSGNAEFRDCDEVNRYVCECDGRTADPARFPNLPDGNN